LDFYIVLGLERSATLNDIKRAYRRLARRYHPDINPGDRLAAVQFRQISEAYETLSDPDRRQRYDVHGPGPTQAEPQTFGFEGFDFSVAASGAEAPTFGDLFAEVLKSRLAPAANGAERGADLHDMISLTFEEALAGGPFSVTVSRQAPCRTCRGQGWLRVAETRCAHCHGTGALRSVRGHMVFSRPCPHCGGAGRYARTRCPTCRGQHTELRVESLTINVPPGLADGASVRVPGRGHAGRDGGEPGDLYVTVRVQPHPIFRREGDEIHVTVPLAVHEAALGARIEVPTPDGSARLRVPPGTQTGQRFRLRERGIRSGREGRRGDLVVEVRLALPTQLDERAKELLREFGRIHGDDVRKSGRDER
jgi:molecular chaperone DnaJ